jgi:hypothetical protein
MRYFRRFMAGNAGQVKAGIDQVHITRSQQFQLAATLPTKLERSTNSYAPPSAFAEDDDSCSSRT